VSGERRHRPSGRLRHLAATLSPVGATAGVVALERDAGLRMRRLREAARDRVEQRLRPSRPRMRALIVAPGGRIAWRSVPAPPPPGPDGAIVRPIAVATCDLDRALCLGSSPFALPMCFGHECVAEVLRVGGRVRTVSPGQRVIVPFQISCGTCAACVAGRTSNCLSVPPISMYGFGVGGGHWGGAVADELAVPFADGMLVALPDGIEPAAAASVADNVSDGWRHVGPHLPAMLERDPDMHVLIVGSQQRRSVYSASVSLYAGLAARALGAKRVVHADARPAVRAHAARLGLDAIEPGEVGDLPPSPLVIDVSVHPKGLHAALSATAPDGVCTSSGDLHRRSRIPIALMYGRNVTLRVGRTNARAVIPEVLDLMRSGRLEPDRVTTHRGALDDAPRLINEHMRGDATKTVLTA
jgi:alcohol dehydrogenase